MPSVMPPLLSLAGLLHAMWRESIYLVQEGIASPADIDRVARLTFGLRLPAMGPLENMDSEPSNGRPKPPRHAVV